MRQLGSVVLAAVLMGVPRALDARAFGQRSVYVDVAPEAPELTDLVSALGRAIGEAACSLASRPSGATVVVELKAVSSSTDRSGRTMEAASFAVRNEGHLRPLVVHYPPSERDRAARAVVEALSVEA